LATTIVVDETTCTLVDAITAANTDTAVGGCAAGSGADTIELTTDVSLTEINNGGGPGANGPNGLPEVISDITVEGGDFTIERIGPFFRFFAVPSNGTLALNDLTLTNGRSTSFPGGGAIWIDNGTVVLTNSTVSGNSAPFGGGGIFLSGSGALILINSTVSDNVADLTGVGGTGGGGIWAIGTVSLTNSTVSGNAAVSTGNIFSSASGGGVLVREGSLSVTNSTLSGNSAFAIVNISGQPSGVGGGISFDGEGSLSVTNSTLSGNSANLAGGGIYSTPVAAVVTNSIVANSLDGGNCDGNIITDNGNNFADDDSCGPGFADITPGVDFDTTLADNGGPTQTHALLPGSVAIDAAGDCGLETDQRGFPRDDGACDSGSFEQQVCGNGIVDSGEECDDGSNVDGDGCAADCTNEGGGGEVPAVSSWGLTGIVLLLLSTSTAILLWRRRSAA
jgi:cysteine-rich repeat protein/parallel beta-helix repeat protein